MKSFQVLLTVSFLSLYGCVSLSKYNKAVLANSRQRVTIEKLNKKANILEQRNKELKDSIALLTGVSTVIPSSSTYTAAKIVLEAGIEISRDSFQTATEKRILYYMNFARVKPREFLQKCVLKNLKDTSRYYEKTLIETLRKMEPVEPLKANKKMFSLANCHATQSGRTGYVGHERKNGCSKGYNAECCAYGTAGYSDDPALNYVLQLLVDEGVPSLGHREIILMGWLRYAGVSIQPHKSYGENVVIDFSAGN